MMSSNNYSSSAAGQFASVTDPTSDQSNIFVQEMTASDLQWDSAALLLLLPTTQPTNLHPSIQEIAGNFGSPPQQNLEPKFRNRSRDTPNGKRLFHMSGGHVCGVCQKLFPTTQQLNQHYLVHSDERKHKCMFCDRAFKQLSHLQQHHRTHTGEKPYSCPEPGCSRAFHQLSNLQHHLRVHYKSSQGHVCSPDSHFCPICCQGFSNNFSMRRHLIKVHVKGESVPLTEGFTSPAVVSNSESTEQSAEVHQSKSQAEYENRDSPKDLTGAEEISSIAMPNKLNNGIDQSVEGKVCFHESSDVHRHFQKHKVKKCKTKSARKHLAMRGDTEGVLECDYQYTLLGPEAIGLPGNKAFLNDTAHRITVSPLYNSVSTNYGRRNPLKDSKKKFLGVRFDNNHTKGRTSDIPDVNCHEGTCKGMTCRLDHVTTCKITDDEIRSVSVSNREFVNTEGTGVSSRARKRKSLHPQRIQPTLEEQGHSQQGEVTQLKQTSGKAILPSPEQPCGGGLPLEFFEDCIN